MTRTTSATQNDNKLEKKKTRSCDPARAPTWTARGGLRTRGRWRRGDAGELGSERDANRWIDSGSGESWWPLASPPSPPSSASSSSASSPLLAPPPRPASPSPGAAGAGADPFSDPSTDPLTDPGRRGHASSQQLENSPPRAVSRIFRPF